MIDIVRFAGILSFVVASMFATNGFAVRHHPVIGNVNPVIRIKELQAKLQKEGDTAPQAPSVSDPDNLVQPPSISEPVAARIKEIYEQHKDEPKLEYLRNPIEVMNPIIVLQRIPIFTLVMLRLLELNEESGDIQSTNQLVLPEGNPFSVYNIDPTVFFMLQALKLSGYNIRPIVIIGIETIKSESGYGGHISPFNPGN